MEKNTLINGFEIFNDFAPLRYPFEDEDTNATKGFDSFASDSLTDEELEALKNNKGSASEKDDKEDDEDEAAKSKEDKTPKKDKEDNKEDEAEDNKEDKSDNKEDNKEDNSEEEPKFDTELISNFAEVINEKLGLKFGEDEKAPETPEELIDYVNEIIEENSKPTYYSEEVEALDNFVKNGGKLKDFFKIESELDVDNINIEDNENAQKQVLKQFLKEKGFSDASIEKKLTKYEDAGLLEDEAEDALEALKEIKETKKQELLKNLEKAAKKAENDQREFLTTVVNEIKGLDDIRGVKIPDKDKKMLFDYIFVRDQEGKSQYQKDWAKSVKNLIESAYFTMKGDTLLKAAKTVGKNDAINRFKQSLNKTGISKQTNKQNTSNDDMSVLDSFARRLRAN